MGGITNSKLTFDGKSSVKSDVSELSKMFSDPFISKSSDRLVVFSLISAKKHLYIMEELLNYVEVTKSVFVLSRWPLSNIKTLVVTLVRKIINEKKNVFSILQVNHIPAKLITRKNKSDCVHVFEEVSGT